MKRFIKGMDLCEQFFNEVARPILDRYDPHLVYSAGLLGYGSDVLGYDDGTSTDHMWGPRFYLFLREEDLRIKDSLMESFAEEFPYTYQGYSVHFSAPDLEDGGTRKAETITQGKVAPLIFIHTLAGYLDDYLGASDLENLSDLDWLSFNEHRLLSLSAGRMFVDGLGVSAALRPLAYYPDNVWLYLIASNWALISEEQAFVRRCSDVGDEIGSILACGRIVERLMRLAFLYCRRYAPYSKWFGTAFTALPVEEGIKLALVQAVCAANITQREENLVLAQKRIADWHNRLGITTAVEVRIQRYFERDIQVIYADRLAKATLEKLRGTVLEGCPPIGKLSSVANFVAISDDPQYRQRIKALYGG